MKRKPFTSKLFFSGLLLALLVTFLSACGEREVPSESMDYAFREETEQGWPEPGSQAAPERPEPGSQAAPERQEPGSQAAPERPESQEPDAQELRADQPEYGSYYYDLENVVLYLEAYGELPPNYITKSEARELGWEGGSVEDYLEGAAIGGDVFGNREGLLPEAKGRTYTECDIDTKGFGSRGSRRLVFSSDGLYFYTADHYESFSEVTVTEDFEVIW